MIIIISGFQFSVRDSPQSDSSQLVSPPWEAVKDVNVVNDDYTVSTRQCTHTVTVQVLCTDEVN